MYVLNKIAAHTVCMHFTCKWKQRYFFSESYCLIIIYIMAIGIWMLMRWCTLVLICVSLSVSTWF